MPSGKKRELSAKMARRVDGGSQRLEGAYRVDAARGVERVERELLLIDIDALAEVDGGNGHPGRAGRLPVHLEAEGRAPQRRGLREPLAAVSAGLGQSSDTPKWIAEVKSYCPWSAKVTAVEDRRGP